MRGEAASTNLEAFKAGCKTGCKTGQYAFAAHMVNKNALERGRPLTARCWVW